MIELTKNNNTIYNYDRLYNYMNGKLFFMMLIVIFFGKIIWKHFF
jgi:hypothetical protein